MTTEDPPVVVKAEFSETAERIWKAITDGDEMRLWFFKNIPEFQPRVGFTTSFSVQSNDCEFVHEWEVAEVDPLSKIATFWQYEGHPGKSIVNFEIQPHQGKTELVLSTKILEDFPDDIPDFSRESCEEGWEFFLNESLKGYLEDGAAKAV